MKINIKTVLVLSLLFVQTSFAQIADYNYKRTIKGVTEEWHSIELPQTIFDKLKPNLSDIRIYKNDSIEIPYLLKISKDKHTVKKVAFTMLNQVSLGKKRYYTFKLKDNQEINQLKLRFNKNNYDFKVILQGSNNQKKWFDITKSRVISIDTESMRYSYNKLFFTTTNYAYYRVIVPSTKVKLQQAYLQNNILIKGEEIDYKTNTTITNKDKKTTLLVQLKNSVPIARLILPISSETDYYRTINIAYLSDSIQTPKGWIKQYSSLYQGTISSLDKAPIHFSSHITNELKIIIYNKDNQPLAIGKTQVYGNKHYLIAHFPKQQEQAEYSFVYGNKKVSRAQYDLQYFSNKIPKKITTINLGNETVINKADYTPKDSFLSSQLLLWGLLIVIILFLGKFSLKMLKNADGLDDIK